MLLWNQSRETQEATVRYWPRLYPESTAELSFSHLYTFLHSKYISYYGEVKAETKTEMAH